MPKRPNYSEHYRYARLEREAKREAEKKTDESHLPECRRCGSPMELEGSNWKCSGWDGEDCPDVPFTCPQPDAEQDCPDDCPARRTPGLCPHVEEATDEPCTCIRCGRKRG